MSRSHDSARDAVEELLARLERACSAVARRATRAICSSLRPGARDREVSDDGRRGLGCLVEPRRE